MRAAGQGCAASSCQVCAQVSAAVRPTGQLAERQQRGWRLVADRQAGCSQQRACRLWRRKAACTPPAPCVAAGAMLGAGCGCGLACRLTTSPLLAPGRAAMRRRAHPDPPHGPTADCVLQRRAQHHHGRPEPRGGAGGGQPGAGVPGCAGVWGCTGACFEGCRAGGCKLGRTSV